MSGYFRIWLRERENTKSIMQFMKFVIDFNDIWETMHELLISQSDDVWRCYRVDFIEITYYT